MAFETNKFNVVKKKRLGKTQFNVECAIETNADVAKVLSVKYDAKADNIEVLNGEINVAGRIDFCVLFATPDGEIGTTNSACPFVTKIENGTIKLADKANINVEVVDYQIVDISDGIIRILCVCEQTCILIENEDVANVAINDDNVCAKKDEIVVNQFIGTATETFNVESQASIKEQIKRLIYADSDVALKNIECGNGFVAVAGEVVTKILYLSANDRFEICYTTEPFKQEIAFENVGENAVCEAKAQIKKQEVRYEVVESDKGVQINFDMPVEVEVFVYGETKQEIVKDLYSTTSELSVSTESFEMTKQLQTEFFETKIDGTLMLDENKPRVDKIMFVGASNLQITNAYVKDREVVVEGIAKTNVVYLNDEENSLNSVLMEVPFVVSDKTQLDCDAQVQATATLYDVDVVVKKGREFYFDAKLKVAISCDCDVVAAVIARVDENEKYPEKDCAIELYCASAHDTAWDIAKAMRTKENVIFEQNPELTFPLNKDENVVIYYQKKA